MPTRVAVNMRTVVHMMSNGMTIAFPDVCKTPSMGPPLPIPYPNLAKSQDTAMGAKRVSADGGNPLALNSSNFLISNLDEPGVAGGVISQTFMGKAEFVSFSFDTKAEG